MKVEKNLLKLSVAIALAGLSVNAANAAGVDGGATALVIAPLSIAETTSMDFGTIAGGAVAGTVVLDLVNGRTVTGDAEIIAAGAGTTGEFTITGASGQAYTLGITAGTLSDGGGNTMAVDTFTDNSAGTLPAATELFQVGATLTVGVDQPAGTYSTALGGGTAYAVTVNYN